jgi:hypothetical protein
VNGERPQAYFRNGGPPESYEGPVVFQGLDPKRGPHTYVFRLPQAPDGTTDDLELWASDGLLTLPNVGAQWWLSSVANVATALFDARGGELQLATGEVALPLDEAHGSALERWLGSGVTLEKRCEYGGNTEGGSSSVWSLLDLVTDTSPPVRARPETLTPLEIGGVPYEIWVSFAAEDGMSFSILRQR